jgi:hypothetical protein
MDGIARPVKKDFRNPEFRNQGLHWRSIRFSLVTAAFSSLRSQIRQKSGAAVREQTVLKLPKMGLTGQH